MSDRLSRISQRFFLLAVSLALFSCSYTESTRVQGELSLPGDWSRTSYNDEPSGDFDFSGQSLEPIDQWVTMYADEQAQKFLYETLQHNYQLLASAQRALNARTRLDIEKSRSWPILSALLSGSRSKSEAAGSEVFFSNIGIDLQVAWEVDLWGRLQASEQAVYATALQASADYQAVRLSLVSNALKAWFNVLEAQQLKQLFQQRLDNLAENADLIAQGFSQGINDAVDVYLARADLHREQARAYEQDQVVLEAARTLQLFMGRYPHGVLQLTAEQFALPQLPAAVPLGVPATVLQRRYDVSSALYAVQAADANVAVAHRARFPSFSLTTRNGIASSRLSELVDSPQTQWSLVGSVLQPIFDRRALRNQEQQARYRLIEQEQLYLDTVFSALGEVESFVSNEQSLLQQSAAFRLANDSSVAAQEQSFELYRKGLVSYATVLESQRRAFDTQTNLIRLANIVLQNRINLHVALGGDFGELDKAVLEGVSQPSAAKRFPQSN